jgi:integrase
VVSSVDARSDARHPLAATSTPVFDTSRRMIVLTMTKPSKPTPDFPLFAHNNGQWAKKIKGKFCYFGPWDDPQGALARYRTDDTQASTGRQPQVSRQSKVSQPTKPVKPRKGFPLYAHASGRWAKKVRGVIRYFGPWDDPQAALNTWLDQKDDLLAGREPRATGEGLTVRSLVNQFLETKEAKVDNSELTQRSLEDYDTTCAKIIEVFGRNRLATDLAPADFKRLRKEFTKGQGKKRRGHGPATLSNDIGRARVVFNYAYKQGLIDRPIVYGDEFKKPSRAVLRRERSKKGVRMFTARQIHAMLDKAGPQLKAMILLGINCGMGNNDCALLPLSAVNLKTGWLTYPRPKTGVERRVKLWPETVAALQVVLDRRESELPNVFVTRYGYPWTPKAKAGDSPISKETTKLLKALKIHRPGLGFYALRHVFETVGGESMDQAAVNYIMGHIPGSNDMSAVYRERMTDQRLFRVAKYVRKWLNSKPSRKAAPVSS